MYKKIVAMACALAMVAGTTAVPNAVQQFVDTCVISASADTSNTLTDGVLTYSLGTNGTLTVTKCDTEATAVAVPEEFEGHKVVRVGNTYDNVFMGCNNLTDITFPDSIVEVGNNIRLDSTPWYDEQPDGAIYLGKALYTYKTSDLNSTVERLDIREGTVSISNFALQRCVAKEVTFPDSLAKVGNNIFDYPCKTEVINIGKTFEEDFKVNRFIGKATSLKKINIAPDNPYYTSVNGVVYDKTVTDMLMCPINHEDLFIPKTVKSVTIDQTNHNFKTITVEAGNPFFTAEDNILYNNDKTKLIKAPYREDSVITIPSSVVEIGDYAFDDTYKIEYKDGIMKSGSFVSDVSIPSSVKRIGDHALTLTKDYRDWSTDKDKSEEYYIVNDILYSSRSSVSGDVTIPDGVRVVGCNAFDYSKNAISSVTFPEGVEIIEKDCFYMSNRLKTVKFPSTISYIGDRAFASDHIDSVEFPDKTINELTIGDNAFAISVSEITLPKGTVSIGTDAFADCSKITIPRTVTQISDIKYRDHYFKTTVYCYADSTAEQFCLNNRINYVLLDEPSKKQPLSDCDVSLSPIKFTYDGTEKTPEITVRDGKYKIYKDIDYTVSCDTGKDVGTYYVTINGIGDYDGSKTISFEIEPISISSASINLDDHEISYDGKAKTPAISVTVNGKELDPETDYDIEYTNNTEIGTAIIAVSGKGNYVGNASTTFEISKNNTSGNPADDSSSKPADDSSSSKPDDDSSSSKPDDSSSSKPADDSSSSRPDDSSSSKPDDDSSSSRPDDSSSEPDGPANTELYTYSDEAAEWSADSDSEPTLVIHRSDDDDTTFEKFTGVEVDGEEVAPENYTAEAGSLRLTFKREYLETLAEGEHTVKVLFTDGSAETKLNISAPEIMRGDVNGDGDINVTDVVKLAAHVKSIKAISEDSLKAADVNLDGDVNVTDVVLVAAHVKGIRALR